MGKEWSTLHWVQPKAHFAFPMRSPQAPAASSLRGDAIARFSWEAYRDLPEPRREEEREESG